VKYKYLWIVSLLLGWAGAASAAITFKQSNFAVPQTSVTSVTVTFTSAQTAGDLNVVVVGWHDSTATVSSIVDTKGNTYAVAVGPTVSSTHGTQTIYYASNIPAAAANGNTVTVTFSTAASKPDVRIAEYSGLLPSAPLDKAIGAVGTTGTAASSGAITTTYANDLIIGADIAGTTTSAAGSGYTQRILTTTDKDILEDKTVTTAGSNTTTATLSASSWWIMQLAAFKATDTTLPTTPTGVTGTVVSATQINLSWTASTDNIGVTAYLVERCTGASCSSFAQIASVSSGTSYNNTGLAPSTSYSYRIRAQDAAGNVSSPSTPVVTKVTLADTTAPVAPASLTATATTSSQINLSWPPGSDNVGVTGYRVERCSGASCSSFAQVAAPTTTAYNDSGLSASTSYTYRVRAADAAGNVSTPSPTATAVTQAAADTTSPTIPAGLAATVVSSSQMNLSWSPSSDNVGVTAYQLQSCAGSGCTAFALLATITSGTAYSNTGLQSSTSYSYKVQALDAAGNQSGYSGPVTAITQSLSATYTYDATGHLKTIATTDGKTVTYGYDAAGNINSITTSP
jgi:YD repeat-containing protein